MLTPLDLPALSAPVQSYRDAYDAYDASKAGDFEAILRAAKDVADVLRYPRADLAPEVRKALFRLWEMVGANPGGFAKRAGHPLERYEHLAFLDRLLEILRPAAAFRVEVPEFDAAGEDLDPLVRRLLDFMSSRPRANLDAVYRVVWGNADVSENARKAAMRKAGEALAASGKPRLRKARGEPVIFWE
jgi:hypothetical protein